MSEEELSSGVDEKKVNGEEITSYDIGQTHLAIAERLGKKAEHDHLAPSADVEYIFDKIQALSVPDALKILEDTTVAHNGDPNFPIELMEKIQNLISGQEESGMSPEDWEFDVKIEAGVIHYHSPYPEIRSIASPFDDPTEPVETWRAYVIGMVWTIVGQGVNTFFNPRFPSIYVTAPMLQLLMYPCGKACEYLPNWEFKYGKRTFKLNHGPWSYKEQTLCTVMMYNAIGSAYVLWNFQVQKLPQYYDQKWMNFGYQILLCLSNNCIGIGLAGLLRRFVIYPVRAIWPTVLPTVALNRALTVPEKERNLNGWTMSRYKFFFTFGVGYFLYYWFPGFIFQALSNFNWTTWIAPNNFNLAVVTGTTFGLTYQPLCTFDWNIIYSFSPLTLPFWSFVQQFAGTFISGFIILAMYYTNYKWSAYLPINSSDVFDNTGAAYDVSNVMTNNKFDEAKYQQYSPAYYSAANILLYGAFFACYPLNLLFVIGENFRLVKEAFASLFYAIYDDVTHMVKGGASVATGGFIAANADRTRDSVYTKFDDPHCRMMRNYKETPDWWFLTVLIIAFVFGIIVITVYPLNTSVWTLFFVVGLNISFLIPMSIIQATAGTSIGLNVVTELIIGYACPNNPEALMLVKAFGYNIDGQADGYLAPNKMGHYAKIPPRAIFRAQVASTIITSFVSVGVMDWMFSNIHGLCTEDQPNKFNCENGATIYFSASVVWGLIGPKRVFGGIYPKLKYCFLIGFLVGAAWLCARQFGPKIRAWSKSKLSEGTHSALEKTIYKPLSYLNIINPVLVCIGFLEWAPYNLYYQWGGLIASFCFMYVIKRRYTGWWEKYNYVLTAALTAGLAFSSIVIFFATSYGHSVSINWWGNDVMYAGVDGYAGQQSLYELPERGYFGLEKGHFPV